MAVCSTGGKLTKKRAPPDLLAPTATFAPILWVISFTIDRPRPLPPAELQSAAPESREQGGLMRLSFASTVVALAVSTGALAGCQASGTAVPARK